MRIYLHRHGEAGMQAASDRERELTERGRLDNLGVAKQFIEKYPGKGPEIDLALCSPYLRARQTAEDLQSVVGQLRFNETDSLVPESDVLKLLSLLDDLAETTNVNSVLLVGHNPLFSDLFSLLVDGESNRRQIGTSNLVCLESKVVAPGFANMSYMLVP